MLLSVSYAHRSVMSKAIGFPEERIWVIRNGVSVKKFQPSPNRMKIRERMGYDDDEVLIAAVGRLVPVKNHKMLIQGFSHVARKLPNVRLLVVGDGPLRGELQRLCSDVEVQSKVEFLGVRMDVPEILQGTDIFALTSISEGMSNTVLEAMSTALPVVATNVGGNSELVEGGVTGILVESKNASALAKALEGLVRDPERRKEMGRRGREKVKEKFNLETMVSEYEGIYRQLVGRRLGINKEALAN